MTSVSAMRAVGIPEPGGPEVLTVVDREVRDAGPGEVRIAVRAAAVNPTDIGLRQRGGGSLAAPWTPGMDAAGTIESVGSGVEHLAVGEAVMAAVNPRRPEGGARPSGSWTPAACAAACSSCSDPPPRFAGSAGRKAHSETFGNPRRTLTCPTYPI